MKELYRFRQFLTEGVTADEITSRVRKLGKEKGIEDKYIEDYIDELDGNFEPDAYENSTDKDLLDDLKSYIDLSEGVIKENEEQGYTLYDTNVEYDNGKTGYMFQLVNSEDGEENEIGFDQLYFDDEDNRLEVGVDFNSLDQGSYQEGEYTADEAMELYRKISEGVIKEDKGINYLKDAFETYLAGGDTFTNKPGKTETVKFKNDGSLIPKKKFEAALQSLPTTVKVDVYSVNFKKVGDNIVGTFKIK